MVAMGLYETTEAMLMGAQNISFPFAPLNSQGRLGWAADNQSVRDVIWNILLTRPGERLMRPEFGAGIREFIHHPNNETTRRLMADVARRSIRRWEPRVELLELTVNSDPLQLNHVILSLRYRLKLNGAQDGFEFGLQLSN